jgi:hypothetical protein
MDSRRHLLKTGASGLADVETWKENLADFLMHEFAGFAEIIFMTEQPAKWSEYEHISKADEELMSKVEISLAMDRNKLVTQWINRDRMKMVGSIIGCMDESSILRVEKFYKFEYDKAKKDGNIPALMDVITKAHTFNGTTISQSELNAARTEVESFRLKSDECVADGSVRFRVLEIKIVRYGVDLAKGQIMYCYAAGMTSHRCPQVNNIALEVATKLNHAGTQYLRNPDNALEFDIAPLQKKLQHAEKTAIDLGMFSFGSSSAKTDGSEGSTVKAEPPPMALTVSTQKIAKKLKNAPSVREDSTSEEGITLTRSEKFIRSLMKKHGISRHDAQQMVICFECRGKGHTQKDCPQKQPAAAATTEAHASYAHAMIEDFDTTLDLNLWDPPSWEY